MEQHEEGGERPTDAGSGLRQRLGEALRSVETAHVVADLDERVNRWRRERKLGKGTLRATHVSAYRGHVAGGRAHIRLRVTERPPIPETGDAVPYVDVFKANVRRFVALPLAGVRVTVSLAGSSADAVTDRRGYAVVSVAVPDLPPGWHSYRCTTRPDVEGEAPVVTLGEVLVPDPAARFAVVSDIDDTVLRTGLTEGMVAVRRTLLRDARTRRPVPGMAALYRGLRRAGGDAVPAFWYLSTGPWAMYDVLTEFLSVNSFPDGPLFLTDWGPNERYVVRSGREHKRETLQRLLADSPDTSFVLVGDSGQGDAEVYVEAAREHPGRCLAVVVLDVGAHKADRAIELDGWSESLADDGIAFHLVPGAADAARALVSLGLLDPDVVDRVRTAIATEAP